MTIMQQQDISQWTTDLKDRERLCPWKPEPITDPNYLIARQGDIRAIERAFAPRQILLLHGETGVGKTSLVQAGLTPTFQAGGYDVLVCNDWVAAGQDSASDRGEQLFDIMVADQLRAHFQLSVDALQRVLAAPGGFRNAMVKVVARKQKKPLVVLDQFEEFLRHANQSQQDDFVKWVRAIPTQYDRESLRVMISLRSEFFPRLQQLLNPLRSSNAMDSYHLLPLAEEKDIRDVVTGPRNEAGEPIEDRRVANGVVDAIGAAWQQSRQGSNPLTLLQIKALLYSLFWRGYGEDDPSVTVDRLDRFITATPPDCQPPLLDEQSRVIELLRPTVENRIFHDLVVHKLMNCAVAVRQRVGDELTDALQPQIEAQIAAMTSFLFTANFKEVKRISRLFRDANRDNLILALGSPDDQLYATLFDEERKHGDLLTVLASPSDDYRRWLSDSEGKDVIGLDTKPWDVDELDRSSGPWLGLAPEEVVRYLIRVFLVACWWLNESHICKVSWDDKEPAISLFHDQLSDALKAWEDQYSRDAAKLAAEITSSPISTIGRRLELKQTWVKSDGGRQYVVNARWPRNEVIGDFTNVHFINCDFRNTRFSKCRFDGVSFVNCCLDGTLFDNCTIISFPTRPVVQGEMINGELAFDQVWASRQTNLSIPKFAVPVDWAIAAQIRQLRGLPSAISGEDYFLYSLASGVAALPVTQTELDQAIAGFAKGIMANRTVKEIQMSQETAKAGAVGMVDLPEHGMTLIGGRVSALMFSGCQFENPSSQEHKPLSSLTLAYVGGSSVDFVEQDSLHLAIYGSAIRGLSVSRPVGSGNQKVGRFQVNVVESTLINTWIGTEIEGEFWADHCSLQSLVALSSEGFTLTVSGEGARNENRSYVNPAPRSEDTKGDMLIDDIDNIKYKTDYRSRPAKDELATLFTAESD